MASREWKAELLSLSKVDIYWSMIERELARIPHTWDKWWTLEGLRDGVSNGRFQVWMVGPPEEVNLTVLSLVVHYPAGPILETMLAFGNHVDECLPAIMAA